MRRPTAARAGGRPGMMRTRLTCSSGDVTRSRTALWVTQPTPPRGQADAPVSGRDTRWTQPGTPVLDQVEPARSTCAGSRGALVKLRRQYGLLKKSRTLPERPCRETASPAFSAPGAGFVEGSLSTDPGSGEGMVWG